MQILLDKEQYDRLAKEARRRGKSVGATVRDAIDHLLDDDADRRMSARRALLRLPTVTTEEPQFDKDALLATALA